MLHTLKGWQHRRERVERIYTIFGPGGDSWVGRTTWYLDIAFPDTRFISVYAPNLVSTQNSSHNRQFKAGAPNTHSPIQPTSQIFIWSTVTVSNLLIHTTIHNLCEHFTQVCVSSSLWIRTLRHCKRFLSHPIHLYPQAMSRLFEYFHARSQIARLEGWQPTLVAFPCPPYSHLFSCHT